MKPKLSDYLIIFASLVAIFASGVGVGSVFARKQTSASAFPAEPAERIPDASEDWETRTLQRLKAELSLDASQQNQISEEIRETFIEIRGLKEDALKRYYLELLELHERILPHVDESQKARIVRDQSLLRETIEKRFEKP